MYRYWESPDQIVFGPDRPFRMRDWDRYYDDLHEYERFVIDHESPDYYG